MAVEVNAVKSRCLGVGGGLAAVFNDFMESQVCQRQTGKLRNVEIRVQRGGTGQLHLIDDTLGRSYPSEPRGELDKNAAPVCMYSLSQISPPGENRPASVDPGEKAQLPGLGNGIVNPVADGDQAGCKKAGPSFCPGKKYWSILSFGRPFSSHMFRLPMGAMTTLFFNVMRLTRIGEKIAS